MVRDCNRDAGEPLGRGPLAPKCFFVVKCFFYFKCVLLFSPGHSPINTHPLSRDSLWLT